MPSLADRPRCAWALSSQPRYLAYHDEEWGVPSRDERHLFEMLVLEGAQAGLAWSTILDKRAGYRRAFADFDAVVVARFDDGDVARLLADPGIVRNRAKVASAIANARATLRVTDELGGLAPYLWSFVDGRPVVNRWRTLEEIPAETERSRRMSRDLKARGFGFVGPTICYALMQAVGLVNDHTVDCFRWAEVRIGG
jgi:DNA-3-methyladenine glycosylase I